MSLSLMRALPVILAAGVLAVNVSNGQDPYHGVISRGPISITKQPQDLLVYLGQPATLTVTAKKMPLYFQWQFQCTNIVGATNNSFTIYAVTTNNVGYYSCMVYQPPYFLLTQPVQVFAYYTNGGITIYGTPSPGGGSDQSGCPLPYVGYVSFHKSISPYGWQPIVGVGVSAQDLNSSLTDVKYSAGIGLEGCGHNGFVSATAAQINASKYYRFTIFYPSVHFNAVPSGTQALHLNGFIP
jgi:hypothetical protein